jgi:hypothetical protein
MIFSLKKNIIPIKIVLIEGRLLLNPCIPAIPLYSGSSVNEKPSSFTVTIGAIFTKTRYLYLCL